MVQQRTPAVRKANKETANAAAKVAAAAAAAAVTTTAAATAAAVPLGRSPGGDALIDSRMFARNVTVRARAPWAELPLGLLALGAQALRGTLLLQRGALGGLRLPASATPLEHRRLSTCTHHTLSLTSTTDCTLSLHLVTNKPLQTRRWHAQCGYHKRQTWNAQYATVRDQRVSTCSRYCLGGELLRQVRTVPAAPPAPRAGAQPPLREPHRSCCCRAGQTAAERGQPPPAAARTHTNDLLMKTSLLLE
jgi:hypothetical protein